MKQLHLGIVSLSARTFSIITLVLFLFIEADVRQLFRVGPSEDLIFLTLKINTIPRYLCLILFSSLMHVIDVLVKQLGSPKIKFQIYINDDPNVYGFSYLSMLSIASGLSFTDRLYIIFEILVLITRLDLAFFNLLAEQVTEFFIVQFLLSKKTFHPNIEPTISKNICNKENSSNSNNEVEMNVVHEDGTVYDIEKGLQEGKEPSSYMWWLWGGGMTNRKTNSDIEFNQ